MKKEYLNEIWKPIKGYEGLYEVSNLGRVKSLVNNKGQYREKILKHNIRNGYPSVTLCKNKKLKSFAIHRLVAEAFLPNPDNLPCVNHKDENRLNNFVDNLEWCTYSYNVNYGTGLKRRSITQSKPVLQYDKNGNFIKEWQSTMECGRNGYCQVHVSECCRGKRKYHKDCIWRYKNEEDN